MLKDIRSVEDISKEIKTCTKCSLSNTRKNTVPGKVQSTTKILLIGEAPGENEDNIGEPFVGEAGNTLDKILSDSGIERSDVSILNVIKCRPPGNRGPSVSEIKACGPFLIEQILAINPDIIVTLGNYSTKFVLGTKDGITKVRGKLFNTKGGRKVFPTFHPAAALYDIDKLDIIISDFKEIKNIISS